MIFGLGKLDWRVFFFGITILSYYGQGHAAYGQGHAADSIPKHTLEEVFKRMDCVIPVEMAVIETEVFAIDGNLSLAIAPCVMGAVNTNSVLFMIDKSKPEQAQLLEFMNWDYNVNRWARTDNLMNVAFDETTKRISAIKRYRGVGDCGDAGEYAWMNGKFSLVAYAIKSNCDGIEFNPAERRWKVPLPN